MYHRLPIRVHHSHQLVGYSTLRQGSEQHPCQSCENGYLADEDHTHRQPGRPSKGQLQPVTDPPQETDPDPRVAVRNRAPAPARIALGAVPPLPVRRRLRLPVLSAPERWARRPACALGSRWRKHGVNGGEGASAGLHIEVHTDCTETWSLNSVRSGVVGETIA